MRLGDLDALKEDIVKLCRQINASNGITVPTLAFTRAIDNAPTIDLKDIYQEGYYDGHLEGYTKAINEERPHGEWIGRTDTEWNFECDQCKGLSPWKSPFCGVCGADMRPKKKLQTPSCLTNPERQ